MGVVLESVNSDQVMLTVTTAAGLCDSYWGEPKRAPHKREVRLVGLYVCPYVHDTKIYKSDTNLRVPSVVDCNVYGRFGALLCTPTFNKHVVTNKWITNINE